jgi:hypothetical protein
MILIQDGRDYFVPNAFEVQKAMKQSSTYRAKFFQTLRLLLLAGFCLLVAIGCNTTNSDVAALKTQLRITGEDVLAKQDESIGILKDNTNALAAIKAKVDTLKASQVDSEAGNGTGGDLSSDPSPNVETVVNDSHGSSPGSQPVKASAVELFEPVRQWYLVSEEWCVNCPKAKATFLAKGWPRQNILTINECKSRFGFKVPYVPYEFGEPMNNTPPVPLSRTVTSSRNEAHFGGSLSHSEMKALHDQLHGGGSWTWPGDLATHLATTHGVSTGGEPLTGAIFPVHRQSGIQNSRVAVRSNSPGQRFVGRARTSARQSCPTCPR